MHQCNRSQRAWNPESQESPADEIGFVCIELLLFLRKVILAYFKTCRPGQLVLAGKLTQ